MKFRPFLIKEQRSLLVARESEETKQILNAVLDMINAVTDKTVNPKKWPLVISNICSYRLNPNQSERQTKINVACQEKDCNGLKAS